jgi:hypothetical protein
MIASSLKEGDDLVDMLLGKEADVNVKSELPKGYSALFFLPLFSVSEKVQ